MSKLFVFFKPYRKKVGLVFVLLFLQTMGTLYVPTLTASIVNDGVVTGDMNYILRTGLLMLLVSLLTVTAAVVGCLVSSNLAAAYCRDIRKAIFTKAQELSISEFNKIGTASMITRSTSDTTLIGQTVILAIQFLLPAPIMSVVGLILAFSINKSMAIIIIVTMTIALLFSAILGKKAMALFKLMQIKMDGINRVLRENITGVRVIRAFNRTEFEKKRFDNTASDYSESSIKINKIFAVMLPIIMVIMNLSIVSIIWFGGKNVSNGTMHIGDIMALIEYCVLILFYLIMGVMVFMYIPRASACSQRIYEVINIGGENKEELANNQYKTDGTEIAHIEFKNVSFTYPNAEEPILSNLSFECRAGETTAIIGGTGSGKSTIASLIPRFFEIQSGSILVNGKDIKDMNLKELRDKIGFVPQKAFLFSGTITENIKYGNENASQSDVEHAASIAQAHSFIKSTEKGYQSYVAQGGNNFSGGQKQRLAIARALVRKPEIYIFDDSFSALDFKTDAQLRKALKNEVKKSAVFIVAQRISTVMEADRIVVIDEGKIAGIGKHKELMKSCKVYYEIAASQLSEEELA